MTAEEVIVVDTHDDLLLILIQLVEAVGLVDRDTWVQQFRMLLVADEQHFAMQIEQTVLEVIQSVITQLVITLCLRTSQLLIEVVLDLTLVVKFIFEPEDITIAGIEEVLFRIFRIKTECIAQEIRADIRLGHTVFVQLDTHIPQVLQRIWHCRAEVSAQAPDIGLAHLPYTEEAQDMVNTICIEIVLHLRETTTPPLVVVLCHHIPVVRWESPVLTRDREIIRRSTCRGVQVEQLRVGISIHRVRRYTNRYIALHCNAQTMRIGNSFAQLQVGMELQEVIEVSRLFVAFVQELGIWLQPLAVLRKEILVFLRGE